MLELLPEAVERGGRGGGRSGHGARRSDGDEEQRAFERADDHGAEVELDEDAGWTGVRRR
jgi:hypothetical protein